VVPRRWATLACCRVVSGAVAVLVVLLLEVRTEQDQYLCEQCRITIPMPCVVPVDVTLMWHDHIPHSCVDKLWNEMWTVGRGIVDPSLVYP
jgi:hypothetical protein